MESGPLLGLDPDRLTPARLWSVLDSDTKLLAARSLYGDGHDDTDGRQEADEAIATAMRFRLPSVRKLPAEKRALNLTRRVRPDNSLATALLLALHVVHRRSMLTAFLDHLGIPNRDGVIDPNHDLVAPDPERLSAAVKKLREEFPHAEVEVYLASLAAMDAEVWGGLTRLLR